MFKVGDKVIDAVLGNGVVIALVDSPYYPVHVAFGDQLTESFTQDGKVYRCAVRQTLFHADDCPDWAKPPLPDIEKNAVLLVRDFEDSSWKRRHFSHWNKSGVPACYLDGRSMHTTNGATITWSYWKLPENEE